VSEVAREQQLAGGESGHKPGGDHHRHLDALIPHTGTNASMLDALSSHGGENASKAGRRSPHAPSFELRETRA
jgi:hypothetical protein